MVAPVFPKGIATWSDKQDEIDVVFAADPNELAADLLSVETTFGVMPQVEKAPITGLPVTYETVDARISDLLAHRQMPVVSLNSDEQFIHNFQGPGTFFGEWNTYDEVFDPFEMYNGADVTIPVTGWWTVTVGQFWDWFSTGYHACHFFLNDIWFRASPLWHWDFAGNTIDGWWQGGIGEQRPGHTTITHQGKLNAGDRIRILSENGCPHTPHRAFQMDFQASFQRIID